jgi:hypothetical protein
MTRACSRDRSLTARRFCVRLRAFAYGEALLRITAVWNIPVACNRSSADFMISSPLMAGTYQRLVPDYSGYRARLGTAAAAGSPRR